MSDKIKVFVVDDKSEAALVRRMFADHGDYEVTNDMYEADMACFVGGADISPELYGHSQHISTHTDYARDAREVEMYKQFIEIGLPMVGICRGGQFLNVMNGGMMFQHVDKHNGVHHEAFLPGNLTQPIMVNSYHHQMMMVNKDVEHELLLLAKTSRLRTSMSPLRANIKYATDHYPPSDVPTDVEAVFFPETQCLCYQPHPEYRGMHNKETRDLFFEFIDEHILGNTIRVRYDEPTEASKAS